MIDVLYPRDDRSGGSSMSCTSCQVWELELCKVQGGADARGTAAAAQEEGAENALRKVNCFGNELPRRLTLCQLYDDSIQQAGRVFGVQCDV